MKIKHPSSFAAALVASALLLSSCASVKHVPASGIESISVAADAMAESMSPAAEDLPYLRSALESFLVFLAEERGQEAVSAIAGMKSTDEVGAFLAGRYGYTAYEEALRAFMSWDASSKAPRWDPKKAQRLETEHFSIVAMPGTAGYHDREYLARLLERQASEVSSLIGPTDAMRETFARNLAAVSGSKIEVSLPPDSRSLRDFGDTARTSYGLTRASDGRLAVVASITLPYYNALSSAVLTHEVTHALDIFYKLDTRDAPPLPSSKASAKEGKAAMETFEAWVKPRFEEIIPSDKGFGEGFAEYISDRVNPLHRALFPDPDALLRAMHARVPPIPDILARSPTTKDRMIRIVRYTELDSFVSYLVDRNGLADFLDFYMSVPLSEKRFEAVFGEGYGEAQAEWRRDRGL